MRKEEKKRKRLSLCIEELARLVPHPELGVGEELFEYLSQVTPVVNVDLLVREEKKGILLSWRDDVCGRGWHVPGGVLRYQETLEERVKQVMRKEIGAALQIKREPIQMEEVIMESRSRGHFLSFLYECRLEGEEPKTKEGPPYEAGDLKWHKKFPEDMVRGQREFYRKYFEGGSNDRH